MNNYKIVIDAGHGEVEKSKNKEMTINVSKYKSLGTYN